MRAAFPVLFLLAGCDEAWLAPDPVAELFVESLQVQGCGTLDGLALTLRTDGVDACSPTAFIRLQEGGRPIGEENGILVELDGLPEFRKAIGRTGAVEVTLPDPRVRCSLYLFRRCPGSVQPLVCGAGSLRAEALDPGGRIRFVLQAGVLDARTGAPAGTGLVLDADFRVSLGTPHRPFSGCPED
ncbi:MAG: hypothetical protein FJ098_06725 [Deltaproteobacteria bacterium]|nr:hypothetical protein [Deltaproteobacteria bacterium]